MQHGFEINTRAFDSGEIHQDLYAVSHGARQRVQTSIVNTQDAQIRQALILLGWTPPERVGTVEIVPSDVIGKVSLVSAAPPAPAVATTSGRRLAHEMMVTTLAGAGQALNRMCEACREDLVSQGVALQDFAIPALRWALLRLGMLEAEPRRR